ncbi:MULTISPECIES: DUF6287 domain-containing protein [Leuconostoc]|uniref:DUF6287 domain-containing protein n=2 Tax=Leuconostoc kimchii TaxID=136609 RepID=D5T2S7_LEUKI|nr:MULTISPECIES: DUF6287 domain-containing protein [Leuconostoc]ADG40576.1 hypothetical protein LKI_05175 [Leuconostoc kimchii IMSNU 11154]AEJ31500.1 hypothetical protein LGMK_07250 [Leuconostoc sp. C2]QBR47039.1 hypothetical protein EW139_02460 [Leuconostoc kimchii]
MKLKRVLLLLSGAVIVIGGGGYVYMQQTHVNQATKSSQPTNSKIKSQKKPSSKIKKQQTGMNLPQLSDQNFSSVAGTWKNSAGDTLVVTEKGMLSIKYDGQVSNDQKIYIASGSISSGEQSYHIGSKVEDGILQTVMGNDPLPTTPGASVLTPFWFIPKGVDVKKVTSMTFNGQSDQSQDRLFTGQQFDERNIYVREQATNSQQTNTNDFKLPQINDQLTFSSGAGGWQTTLKLNPDGQFSGEYLASSMGDTAADHPNGTSQNAIFSGNFNKIKRVNETSYQMRIDQLNLDHAIGQTEIVNGVKKTWVKPYGMDDPDKFTLYLPDQKISDLPSNFWRDKSGTTWNENLKTQDKLNRYALLNQSTGYTFLSPEISNAN